MVGSVARSIRELPQHRAGGTGVDLVEPADVGERVEQEVRLDLRLRGLQHRFVERAVEVHDALGLAGDGTLEVVVTGNENQRSGRRCPRP